MKTTLEMVTAALAPTEAILAAEYDRQLNAQFSKFVAQLVADGMDAEKSYSYPSSSMGRERYMLQVAAHKYMQSHSKGVQCSRSFKDPDIRTVDENATRAKFTPAANKMAKMALEGYCAKLAAKLDARAKEINVPVESVKYQGGLNPWGYSHVYVNHPTVCGAAQIWRTQMIINVSCLGKVFNQWPTRRVA
jgi:hypothetical protein